jgi:small GTP-binding protein
MELVNNMYNIELLPSIAPENDEGNIEYKYRLTNLTPEKLANRMTQMKYRINEGSGEAFYHIGVMDDGTLLGLTENEYIESVKNLYQIATNIECFVTKLNESIVNNSYIGEFLIRESDKNNYVDLKIGVAGNVDAGKSTTIGTLTKNILDDGRGKARLHVFNYKHEIDSGRTSSIGHQIMGFDSEGNVITPKTNQTNAWIDIVNQSSKIISFFDLAGHERYLRTTIYGLTSMYPDYCLIMVGANMGINHMTREHISLCLTLKIPFIIVVSKIDIVPENVLEETMKRINHVCKNGANKIPYNIKTRNDVLSVVKNIKNDAIIPIIQISNVTNFNLDLLKFMLNLLPVRNDFIEFINKPIELLIDNTYSVTGHPTIVSGILRSGTIKVNDNIAIGPFFDGSYRQVKVRSIHCKYKDIKEARAGTYICISLKNVLRKDIKKGMVLVTDNNQSKIAVKDFWAFINILHSPTTIRIGYQPFIHVDQVRQSVKIVEIRKIKKQNQQNQQNQQTQQNMQTQTNDNALRTGDKAQVKLEFIMRPEYIKPQMKLIFREGKVKAVGKVIDPSKVIDPLKVMDQSGAERNQEQNQAERNQEQIDV